VRGSDRERRDRTDDVLRAGLAADVCPFSGRDLAVLLVCCVGVAVSLYALTRRR
jgi:hypothetical protein